MARPPIFLNCNICGILFKRKRKRQRFCSFSCGSKGKKYVQKRFQKKIMVKCDFCENKFEKWPCLVKKIKNEKHYCNPKCRKLAMWIGETSYGFKKGNRLPLNPYIRRVIDGKFVLEHRWLIEQHLNRKLERWEHVHHINGNPKDNRIENLKVLSNSDHAKTHFSGKKKSGEGSWDGALAI
jgi:hypothetical protein